MMIELKNYNGKPCYMNPDNIVDMFVSQEGTTIINTVNSQVTVKNTLEEILDLIGTGSSPHPMDMDSLRNLKETFKETKYGTSASREAAERCR